MTVTSAEAPEAVQKRSATPHLVIRPRGRWSVVRVSEVWEFRDLLQSFALRDIKLRYRQTALGAIWVILQPLLAAGIFAFVFGRIAKLPSNGVPYLVFSYAGLLGWNVFSGVLTRSSSVLVGNSALVSKVYFPRILLPVATVASALLDFFVALAMMAALMAAYGVKPGWAMALVPVWLLITVLLSLGIGLMASALMVRYRDVQYVLPVAVQSLLYATPVAYALSAGPASLRWVVELNPLTGVLEAFRWSLLSTPHVPLGAIVWSSSAAVGTVVIGGLIFASLERDFADVI